MSNGSNFGSERYQENVSMEQTILVQAGDLQNVPESYITTNGDETQYFSILDGNSETILNDMESVDFEPNIGAEAIDGSNGVNESGQVVLYRVDDTEELYGIQVLQDESGNLRKYQFKVRQTEEGILEALPDTLQVLPLEDEDLQQSPDLQNIPNSQIFVKQEQNILSESDDFSRESNIFRETSKDTKEGILEGKQVLFEHPQQSINFQEDSNLENQYFQDAIVEETGDSQLSNVAIKVEGVSQVSTQIYEESFLNDGCNDDSNENFDDNPNKNFNNQSKNYNNRNKNFNNSINKDFEGCNKNFNDSNEQFNDSNDRFNDPNEHFNDDNENFNDRNENFNDRNENFNDRNENISNRNENFNDSNNFHVSNNFNDSNENFNDSNEHFNDSNEHFNDPNESFNDSNENFDDEGNENLLERMPEAYQSLLRKNDEIEDGDDSEMNDEGNIDSFLDDMEEENDESDDYETVEGDHVTGDDEQGGSDNFGDESIRKTLAYQRNPGKRKIAGQNILRRIRVKSSENDSPHFYYVIPDPEKENLTYQNSISVIRTNPRSILKTSMSIIEPKKIAEDLEKYDKRFAKSKEAQQARQFHNYIAHTKIIHAPVRQERLPRKQKIKPMERADQEIVVQEMFVSSNGFVETSEDGVLKERVPLQPTEFIQLSDSEEEVEKKPRRKRKSKKKPFVEITISDSDEDDLEVVKETPPKRPRGRPPKVVQASPLTTDSSECEPEEIIILRVDNKCPKCPKSFPSEGSLRSHMQCHAYEDDSDVNFMCEKCGEQFKNSSLLNRHAKTHVTAA